MSRFATVAFISERQKVAFSNKLANFALDKASFVNLTNKLPIMKALVKISLISALMMSNAAFGQVTELENCSEKSYADSVIHDFDSQPSFGLYQDNYITIGTDYREPFGKHDSDTKFLLSIRQRFTKSVLPFNSHLFLSYTQKAVINVLEASCPLQALDMNLGIGLSKPLFGNNRLLGKMTLLLEHESNGRKAEASRTWDKITYSTSIYVKPNYMVYGKVWIPIFEGRHNKDICKYSGIFQTGMQYISQNGRWVMDATFVKRQGWDFNFNTIVNVSFKLSKKHDNYLLLHFYDGYGENMLDYNKYHCRLHMGFSTRPSWFSEF